MTKKKKKKKGQGQSLPPGARPSLPPTSARPSQAKVAPASEKALVAACTPPLASAIEVPPAREKLEEKIEQLEQKLDDKRQRVAAKAREGFESTPDAEDVSIPPVVEDEFFAQGDAPPRVTSPGASGSFDAVVPDARASQKASLAAQKRRGELAKYVKGAVAVSAAILALGVIKVTFWKPKDEPVKPVAAVQVHLPPEIENAQPPKDLVPVVTPEIKPEEKKPEEQAKPQASKPEEKKEEPVAQVKPEETKPEPPARTAAQEKALAQSAIERNNAGAAIAAGERSVALDPSDAEVWLILGAGYQMQGRNAEAKAAFTKCTKQAKRGPVGECTQMLSQ